MKVLFATPEFAPLVKTGGLGDVSAALPRALRALGHDVRVLMPAYGGMASLGTLQRVISLPAWEGWPAAQLLHTELPDGQVLWLLSCPALYPSSGTPYGDPAAPDLHAQALRFGFLSRVAAWLATADNTTGWHADVLHANDWPAGLAPLYLRQLRDAPGAPPAAKSVVTLHNLAFQGIVPMHLADMLQVAPIHRGIEGVEYWGQLSMLKAALQFADAITTVSPTYAAEIQQPALGAGLDGVLRVRAASLHGILNGIDTGVWNPASDPLIAMNYDSTTLAHKAANTRALRARTGLVPSTAPLFGFVGRLTTQKGIDWILASAPRWLATGAQLVVLGRGDAALEHALLDLAQAHPGSVHATLGFDETLAHLIEAGADCFLMPSRFEPCGLNQMYSMAYGTPPVVTPTGGLADTVEDVGDSLERGTGFVMETTSQEGFDAAMDRVLCAWRKPELWKGIQQRGMARDFGWGNAARQYSAIYTTLADNTTG